MSTLTNCSGIIMYSSLTNLFKCFWFYFLFFFFFNLFMVAAFLVTLSYPWCISPSLVSVVKCSVCCLRRRFEIHGVQLVLEVVLFCTRSTPTDRPSMEEVLKLLSGSKLQRKYKTELQKQLRTQNLAAD